MVETVSVAHDSKNSVRTRQLKNVDQLTHCGGLRLAVIGTNKDDGIALFVCQTAERRAEDTEDASFEETRLPSDSDHIQRQGVP